MALPVHRRTYDAFLSHAHADRAFVDELYRLLEQAAGFNIWYDAKKMTGGQGIGSGLQAAIEECRGMLLIASQEALNRGWVKAELDIARVEQASSRDFRIVPLRIGDADVSSTFKGQSWIDVPGPTLNAELAARVLNAFYPADNRPDPRASRDVYLSASWHSADSASAIAVSKSLHDTGFRLVGDSKDQKGFKLNRIQSIIESCGAFVGIIPYRDGDLASAMDKPYKYFVTELDIALKANIPSLIIADPRIRRVDGDDGSWIRMDTQASACSREVADGIEDLWERWIIPPHPHEIFVAVDLATPSSYRDSELRNLIERVTGMRTIVGNEIREADLQKAIMQSIKDAFLVIADLTGNGDDNFNLNVCIEAGMALASGVELALMARGRTRRPPFMLRRAGQLTTYANDVEQLALVHSITRPYRRRIINSELSRY